MVEAGKTYEVTGSIPSVTVKIKILDIDGEEVTYKRNDVVAKTTMDVIKRLKHKEVTA